MIPRLMLIFTAWLASQSSCVRTYNKFEQLSLTDKNTITSGNIDPYCDLKTTDRMNHYVKCEVKKSDEVVYSKRSERFYVVVQEIQKKFCDSRGSNLEVSCIPDPSPSACSVDTMCTMEFDPHICFIKEKEREHWNMPNLQGKGGNRCVAYKDLIKQICDFNQDPEQISEDKVVCQRTKN